MQKEEFPTFLNEQPKVIFGRTGREMLIIACGCVAAYSSWSPLQRWFGLVGLLGLILHILFASVPISIALVIALATVAERPLEEWFMVVAIYVFLPKLFVYMPLYDEAQDSGRTQLGGSLQESNAAQDTENDE